MHNSSKNTKFNAVSSNITGCKSENYLAKNQQKSFCLPRKQVSQYLLLRKENVRAIDDWGHVCSGILDANSTNAQQTASKYKLTQHLKFNVHRTTPHSAIERHHAA